MTEVRSGAVLSVRGVTKSYGANTVLHGIDLDLAPGKALGLVGENGAGKSTLLNIISGRTQASVGSVSFGGADHNFGSPRAAREAGVVLIPQELAYVPHLSVAENLLLANWPARRWTVSRRWLHARGQEALDRLGLSIDARRKLVDLSLADRQLVEIAKALMGRARLLILDEPTASLHARETAFLLGKLHELKASGVSLIYVSHHLDELFEISDEIAVLRNGRVADVSPASSTSIDRTVALMLGGAQPAEPMERSIAETDQALRLSAWSTSQQPRLNGCDIEIRRGEVVGVFGLVGSGAETVARGLGGHQPHIAGEIVTSRGSHRVPRSPREARKLGIAYVPAERKADGLALNQTIAECLSVMILSRFGRGGAWLDRRRRDHEARERVRQFDIRCSSIRQEVGELSGGNQQKVLVASRMIAEPDVLVLHEPTRGVDIGSRRQIHRYLTDYARSGAAVVIVTADVQEAIDATDRLLIMRDGRIVDELHGSQKNQNAALSIAAGGSHG